MSGGSLYIFLDEGGNLDFSPSGTKYFILTGISAQRPFTAFETLGSYKFDLIEYGLDFVFFHCTEDNRHIRRRVFGILQDHLTGLRIDALIVEKSRISAERGGWSGSLLNSPLSCCGRAWPETGSFACGVPSLDDWLKKQVLKNEVSGASRTYVVCESGSRNVVGFYALATDRKQAPGRISRARCRNPCPWLFWAVWRWVSEELQECFSGRIAVFDLQAAAAWAKIQAEAEAAGKVMPVMDRMIAATAIANGLAVAIPNIADMESSGAVLINPWSA